MSSKLCSAIKEMEKFYKNFVKFLNREKELFLLKSEHRYGIVNILKIIRTIYIGISKYR